MHESSHENPSHGQPARRVSVQQGDISRLGVDAIVNAANEALMGGSGVDGAIHRGAGPELLDACYRIPEVRLDVRCPTGEARLTPGFRLPARHVIHTVGPIWRGGDNGEPQLLANCYRNSLQLAVDHELATVAFPAISCGVYRFPLESACKIAVATIRDFLAADERISEVILVAFDTDVFERLSGEVAATA